MVKLSIVRKKMLSNKDSIIAFQNRINSNYERKINSVSGPSNLSIFIAGCLAAIVFLTIPYKDKPLGILVVEQFRAWYVSKTKSG